MTEEEVFNKWFASRFVPNNYEFKEQLFKAWMARARLRTPIQKQDYKTQPKTDYL